MSLKAKVLGSKLAVGLVHHPVSNRGGKTVTSSVTSLDVHDMARLCRTYEVSALYIITPLEAQARLVSRIISHWTTGYGGRVNPERAEAMKYVKVVDSIEDMVDNFLLDVDRTAIMVTSARQGAGAVGYAQGQKILSEAQKAVLLFGTAHGLAEPAMKKANVRLAPIPGAGDYNHLPVRCAASIILDRLLGRED